MSSARITYSPRHDARPDQERNVLAAVYKLCLSSHAKEAAPKNRPDDARKDQDARTYRHCT